MKLDGISELPDPLLCDILSRLPLKKATSILSHRNLWLCLPRLELDIRDFPNNFNAFLSLGNRFFHSNRVSGINKFKVYLFDDNGASNVEDVSYLTSWIEAAVKRGVQHLDVFCPPDIGRYEIPTSLCICKTLVSLKLHEVVMTNAAEFVFLPCLKTMHLKYCYYGKVATFERLISCCPVLEKLKIVECETQDYYKCIQVHSLSVKKLNINLRDCIGGSEKYGVVIDAPLLGSLTIDDDKTESYIINNLSANAKLDINLDFGLQDLDEASVSSRRSSIRDFLLGISKVEEMIVYQNILKIIFHYSKLEPMPQFGYMSRLYAYIYVPDLKWLLTLLASCPNLKSLILVWDFYEAQQLHSEEMNHMSFPFVPECLLSSLKSVVIKTSISGHASEMKIVRYFLENSVILKKLTLRLNDRANVNGILKKLLKIPRRSITCEVVVK
ncbi:PREDICTED: putative FBD-associated F-box protein At5g53635 [Camelina sativa]|uniref:FBD-associated F-box protein At5g53635 n=1 Tax=Camelina sativa TaxID=90675 RepID=A0ABM0WPH4_CAMSA|nr:PREDICTED: putative FBD-associated F-box protein At5g53635 [Camelina sativa]